MNKKLLIPVCIISLLCALMLAGCDDSTGEALNELGETIAGINDKTEDKTEENPQMRITEAEPEENTEEVTEADEAAEDISEETAEEAAETVAETPDENAKKVVDLIFFMGQSNMAGCGGNAAYAPAVPEECGYEFRAISDPTRLYPITEPFGVNENNLNAIMDLPGAKKGSLVSSFVNTYYELTKTPVIAVSASAGATDTEFWMSEAVKNDFVERIKRAVVWLEANNYEIRYKYVVWLQGESDAIDNTSTDRYIQNMDNIIRPMFIEGVEKVFFITPGRTITRSAYFDNIIAAQIKMSRESSYYALGTTLLSGISTEYMVDEWHYNQMVLNLLGRECANSVASYTINRKECTLYDYKNKTTYIPDVDHVGNDEAEPLDLTKCDLKTKLD